MTARKHCPFAYKEGCPLPKTESAVLPQDAPNWAVLPAATDFAILSLLVLLAA